jgi:hypothetical protein
VVDDDRVNTASSLLGRFVAVLALTAIGVGLVGCSGGSTPPPAPAHTLKGEFLVADLTAAVPACEPTRRFWDAVSDLSGTQVPCNAQLPAPYAEARAGAPVTVTSTTGTVLGSGRLGKGTLSAHGIYYLFTVENLPSVPSYVVHISTLTSETYSRPTLNNNDWIVQLTVGHKAM